MRGSETGLHGWRRAAYRALISLAPLSVMLAAGRAYGSGKPWMFFFQDDFYYYLKIAQNLAHGRGSTWNGLVATNGYHPLWLLVLTGFSRFSTNGWMIFFFVVCMVLLSTVGTFLLADRLLQQADAGPLIRRSFAVYLAVYSLHIFYTGMEVILALPLMFLAIYVMGRAESWSDSFGRSALVGLLVSATMLARLDLMIFAGLLVLCGLLNREVRARLNVKNVGGAGLGLAVFGVYLLVNHHDFGIWLPVSGMAKQLKFTHAPSLRPWQSMYGRNVNNLINLLPVHLAVLSLPLAWKRLTATQKVIFPAVLLFPFVYVGLLSCVSDWQLWLWYMYPLRAALCVSFILFSLMPVTGRMLRTRAAAAAVAAVVAVEVGVSKWWTDLQPEIYAAAVEIRGFSETHPGVYAMGDRSGMVAYLLPYPVVQTEGLVMDRTFLQHIRRQDGLLPTLAAYQVDYFVGTAWKPYAGCFDAVEPLQAGNASAHMRGRFCAAPLAGFQHNFGRTLIFDVNAEVVGRGRPSDAREVDVSGEHSRGAMR